MHACVPPRARRARGPAYHRNDALVPRTSADCEARDTVRCEEREPTRRRRVVGSIVAAVRAGQRAGVPLASGRSSDTRRDKTRRDKTRQDKTMRRRRATRPPGQGKARQGKARQGKARQGITVKLKRTCRGQASRASALVSRRKQVPANIRHHLVDPFFIPRKAKKGEGADRHKRGLSRQPTALC